MMITMMITTKMVITLTRTLRMTMMMMVILTFTTPAPRPIPYLTKSISNKQALCLNKIDHNLKICESKDDPIISNISKYEQNQNTRRTPTSILASNNVFGASALLAGKLSRIYQLQFSPNIDKIKTTPTPTSNLTSNVSTPLTLINFRSKLYPI